MNSPQVFGKFYIKGKHAKQRGLNYEKIAKEHYGNNYSEMINDTMTKYWGLDPETGEKVKTHPKACPK